MSELRDSLWYWRARLDSHRTDSSPVVDGDTIDLVIDTGFYQTNRIRLRLEHIDTAEVHGVDKDSDEYQRGVEHGRFVSNWLTEGVGKMPDTRWPFIVKTQMTTGKYGRWVGDIWRLSDDSSLVTSLIEEYPNVQDD